jgi:hypothetical protein
MGRSLKPQKIVLALPLFLVMAGCTKANSPGLQIVSPPLVTATFNPNAPPPPSTLPPNVATGEFTFHVAVRNTSTQPTQANQVYIRIEAKDFTAGPACQGGASSFGQEKIDIPALQPSQTWTAADKQIMQIPAFQSALMTCSCKINQCSGTMRFALFNENNQPYPKAQSIIEVQWDKSGDVSKNVVTDKSLSQ